MSIELATVLLFGGLIVLLMLGVHLAFALAAISLFVTLLVHGPSALFVIAQAAYDQITSTSLMTITMFVIMGNFLVHSGISDRMFQAFNYWLSGVRGGLAIVAIVVCVMLAMTGGLGPGIITMGLIAVPAMLKRNYDKSLALGSVMAGAVLGQVIPPSVVLIVFAFIGRISVGKLFMACFVPGLFCALLYSIYVLVLSKLKPEVAPLVEETVTWRMRFISLKEVILPLLLVFLVLGSIFLGIATPTEAAGIGALGTFAICIISRNMNWKILTNTCRETMKVTGMVIWIIIAATFFGMVYSGAGAQSMMLSFVEGLEVNRWVVMIAMQIILLVFGAFMDDFAIITICAPIFLPIAKLLGFDLVWFSVIFILNIQVAYLTPPFGWSLIMMKGVAPPGITTGDIWRSVPPFVMLQLLGLLAVMLFPQLALWLPGKMF